MHKFKVYESSAQGAEIAVMDQGGQCHIARTEGLPPPTGTELDGPRGSRRPERFQCTATGKSFRVAFVALDCDRQTTIERFHPDITR